MSILELVLAALLLGSLGVILLQTLRLRRARVRILQLQSSRNERRAPAVVRHTARMVRAVAETTSIVRNHGVSGLVASSLEDFTRWVTEDRSEIVRLTADDGTLTIMFSDIEGSTELNEKLGDRAWLKVLAQHDSVVRKAITEHDGHVVKNQGDGFMIVFRDPDAAAHAAWDIQDAMTRQKGRLRFTPISVRIGMHRGPVIARDDDFFGRNVAMAARVASEAQGGEILVSDAVREPLAEQGRVSFAEPVQVRLKGLEGEHVLWQILGYDETIDIEPTALPRWRKMLPRH